MKRHAFTFAIAIALGSLGCTSLEYNPPCEVFGTACEFEFQSCYADHTTGEERCSDTGAPTQDQLCDSTPEGVQLVSGCAENHGCHLTEALTQEQISDGQQAKLRCAFYCDPTGAGTGCGDVGGPGPSYRCCEIRSFYNAGAENAPAALGMCVAPSEFVTNINCPSL